MNRSQVVACLLLMAIGGSMQPSTISAAGTKSQSGCDVSIPATDPSDPTIDLKAQLPDGRIVDLLSDPALRDLTVPSASDVTLRAGVVDNQGAQNVQLWLASETCVSSGDTESCEGPGLQGRPAIENPDNGSVGQGGCRERRVEYIVRASRTSSSRTSIQVSVVGKNFGRKKVSSKFIWLRPGPAVIPALTHDADRLQPGQGLRKNESISAPGSCFTLWMQQDGNFVLYSFGRPKWSTGTHRSGGEYVIMQGDGNLVIYDQWNAPVWASHTNGNPSAVFGHRHGFGHLR